MRVLKIAVISDSVAPFNKGGKETRIDNINRELVALGHDVHIYTMNWWGGKEPVVINGMTYHAISKLYPLYKGDRRSIVEGVMFGIASLRMITYDYDLLEVDQMPYFPLFSTKFVSLLKRKPLYATWHEVWGQKYWDEYLGGVKGKIASLIERISVKLPSHISAASEHTLALVRDVLKYKGSLELVNNGVNYETIQAIQPSKDSYDILYAGRLLNHKNVDVLIDAIALSVKAYPNISCAIIGDGPEFENLSKQITRLELTKNVTMLGFLESQDDVYAAMKSSKIFVLPSSREGFGIAVLEAYVCGAQIITVNEKDNAAQYVLPQSRAHVVDLSPATIAEAINTIMATSQTYHPSDISDYKWSTAALKMQEVYLR